MSSHPPAIQEHIDFLTSSSVIHSDSRSDTTLPDELLAGKLGHVRDEERRNTTYLGHANLNENVVWIENGRGHRLVEKELVDSFSDTEDSEVRKDATKFSALPSADLSVIARISREDCWLAPDGFWKGRTKVTPSFADLKLSFTAEPPGYPEFDTEFDRVLDNIQLIMAARETPNTKLKKGLLSTSNSTAVTKIKFRHVLFIRKEDEDGEASEPSNLPPEFMIENWPAESDEARDSLSRMVKTHTVMPLPAYDIEENLMLPDAYRTKIPGGLAIIRFNLAHWYFAANKESPASDTYVADVTSITMLQIPKPAPRPSFSPRKKRPALTNPRRNESPKKGRMGSN